MNKDYKQLVNETAEFRKHYKEFFSGTNIDEYITQSYMQSLELRKRRLDKKNIELKYDYPDPASKARSNIEVRQEQNEDTITVKSDLNIKKSYLKDGKVIEEKEDSVLEECVYIHSNEENKEVTCPKCGVKGTKEEFLRGCPYCGAKFSIAEFDTKVAGYRLEHNNKKDVKETRNKCFFLGVVSIALLIVSLFINAALMMSKNMTPVMVIFYRLTRFIKVVSITAMVVCVIIYFIQNNIEELIYSVLNKNKKLDTKSITSALEYKLASIHFSDSPQESALFVTSDIADLIPKYKDIIDCSIDKCYLNLVKQENQYANVDAIVKLNIVQLKNNRIIHRKEHLKLRLSTLNTNLNKKKPGIVCYTCPKCGSTIDLLSGGFCKACCYKMDLIDVDWVITKYQVPDKKIFRKCRNWFRYIVPAAIVFTLLKSPESVLVPIRTTAGMISGKYTGAYVATADVVPSLKKVDPKAKQTNVEMDHGRSFAGAVVKDSYSYEWKQDQEQIARKYINYLKKHDGFKAKCINDQTFELKRKLSFMSSGECKVTVSFQNDLTVTIEMKE